MSEPVDQSAYSLGDQMNDRTWTCEELERLYCQALDAVGAVADDLTSVTRSLSGESEGDTQGIERPAVQTSSAHGNPVVSDEVLQRTGSSPESGFSGAALPLSPAQVIEALLFVGGQSLTAKAICGVLRGDSDADLVERAVEELNNRYAIQNRPYSIVSGEGGYRISLRAEFESLRNRVYGFGPREVKLSQETLEILALVAYRQPISRKGIEEIAKRNAAAHLRQLLERELIVVDQAGAPAEPKTEYRTSPRFLQLFGVGRVEDLPQIEDLNYK